MAEWVLARAYEQMRTMFPPEGVGYTVDVEPGASPLDFSFERELTAYLWAKPHVVCVPREIAAAKGWTIIEEPPKAAKEKRDG